MLAILTFGLLMMGFIVYKLILIVPMREACVIEGLASSNRS